MRKLFVTLMTSLLACSSAFAFFPEALDSNLEIGVGYRQDRFKWETSADTQDTTGGVVAPISLRSELEWKNLRIWQIEVNGKYVTCDNIYFRFYGDYGWIVDGCNRDSDFLDVTYGDTTYFTGSGYGTEFSRSRSKSKGHVYDASLALGYQFKMCDDTFGLSPVVGYSWHGKHLDIHNGDSYYDATYYTSYYYSSINGLHSEYQSHWNGPFVGLDFDYKLGCSCEWALFGSYEYHWAWYHGHGDWNLRTDLPDGFRHYAKKAWGQIASIGLRWDFCDCWSASILGRFQWWEAKNGRDVAKIAEVSAGEVEVECFQKIRLRKVEWDSASVSINIGMAF